MVKSQKEYCLAGKGQRNVVLADQRPLAAHRQVHGEFLVGVEQGFRVLIDPAIVIRPEVTCIVDNRPGRFVLQRFLMNSDPLELDGRVVSEPVQDGPVIGAASLSPAEDMGPRARRSG
jgi:hypothetical protein